MGGWTPAQFAENRLPTLAELDAAAPNNPVLVFNSFTGPATTNTLGKSFFIGKGVTVDDAGNILPTGPSIAALNALRAIQTFDDKKQGTLDAMAYSASVGVTTNVDMGGFVIPRSKYPRPPTNSTPWRAGTPSPPTTHSSHYMMKAMCPCACASSSSAWTILQPFR